MRPDDRVAICVERGPEMIIGLLGILKAGAAYVPLDPAYPLERIAFTLDDSAPAGGAGAGRHAVTWLLATLAQIDLDGAAQANP